MNNKTTIMMESLFEERASSSIKPTQALTIDQGYDNEGVEGSFANGGHTDDATPRLSGMAEPGALVDLWDGTTYLGQARANEKGEWFLDVPQLELGEHSIFASCGDETSDFFVFTVDAPTTPPGTQPLVIEQGYDDEGVEGTFMNGGHTDDATPRLSGTAAPNAVIKFYDNLQGYLGEAVADAKGHWTFDVPGSLLNGQHSIYGVAGDQSSDNFTFTVDAPTGTIEQGYDNVGTEGVFKNGDHTDDATPLLSGTAHPNAHLYFYDDSKGYIGEAYADADGRWSFQVPDALSLGTHSISAQADGQWLTGGAFVFTVDAPTVQPPVEQPLVITQGYDDAGACTGAFGNNGHTDDAHPRLSGTAGPNAVIDLYDSQQGYLGQVTADGKGQWFFDASLDALGKHTITAVSGDQSSNAFVFTLDAPTAQPDPQPLVITQGYDDEGAVGVIDNGGYTDDATPRLFGTADPDRVITLYDSKQGYLGQAYTDENSHWTFDVPNALPLGEHTITAYSGSLTSEPFVFTIGDATTQPPVPQAPVIEEGYDNEGTASIIKNGDHTDDATPLLSGTAKANATVSFYDSELGYLGKAVADENGHWTFEVHSDIGVHSITAESNGLSSEPFVFTVDPAPVFPTLPVIEHVYDNSGSGLSEISVYGHTGDSTPLLTGTAEPGALVSFYVYPLGHMGEVRADANGHWSFEIPQELGMGRYSVIPSVEGQLGAPFVFDVDAPEHAAPGVQSAEGLSANDMLSSGESDLFAAEHTQDVGHLALQDVEGGAMESATAQGANVSWHDVASLNGSLVLPNEHASAVM
ncbi:Ig-like domain-containing protein [Dyella koreensis]|uniref:Bacterial Ig-like domain-containing protein n=1 Tax=Dyella koreensis TaxID=311235 RepID=A0ABW8K0X2_9GAMM